MRINLFTKEIGLEIRFKAMESILEAMVAIMMVIGLIIKCMGLELIFGLMVISIQAIMSIIKKIAEGYIVSRMGLNMKDNGKMERNTAMQSSHLQME